MENAMLSGFPKVDDGSLYPDIVKYIKNQRFVWNIEDHMSFEEFNGAVGSSFAKIADCVLNVPENFPNSRRNFISGETHVQKIIDYIPLTNKKQEWYDTCCEWVYIITYNSHIVKIGKTSSGLNSRFTSYNCGTKKNMKKGSCSTTNFIITESNYLALLLNYNVEIYSYLIPKKITKEIIFGRTKDVLNKQADEYEDVLMEIYKEMSENLPPLCVS